MPKYWKNKVKTFLASNKALFNYGVKKKIDVYHPNLKKEKKKKNMFQVWQCYKNNV